MEGPDHDNWTKVMPGAGEEPLEQDKRSDCYTANLGEYAWDAKNKVERFKRIGLKRAQDGEHLAAYFLEENKLKHLEEKLSSQDWDLGMEPGKMASGANTFPEAIKKIGDAVSKARLNLHLQHPSKELSAEHKALFAFAEEKGTRVENLRLEEGKRYRVGNTDNRGTGNLLELMRKAFADFLSADDLAAFTTLETKLSPVKSVATSQPWPIFDPVAMKEKWGGKVPNIETVMTEVTQAYSADPTVAKHEGQAEAIRDTNRRIKNWKEQLTGSCN
jgi:hypothetical protein